MVKLPDDFVRETRRMMGDERFERYLKAFEEEPPVSIRLNPHKVEGGRWRVEGSDEIIFRNVSTTGMTGMTAFFLRAVS